MGNLIGMEDNPIGTADLIQQMTSLAWALDKDTTQPYSLATSARIGYELYQRATSSRIVDVYQAQCLAAITAYIHEHPIATGNELAVVVKIEIDLFRNKVDAL